MTVARGTIARLRRQLAEHHASLPPFCRVLEEHEGEPDEAWRARRAEAERQAEAFRASGRRAHLIIVDREDV